MMYAKLALRNVRRTARDYLIYVVTLVLSVGMFYGFFSLVSPYYNATLPVPIHLDVLKKMMRIAVPLVGLFVVFLMSYVNSYMLRRKQKEFAIETIIGMEQKTVAFLFFLETSVMGAAAILLGVLLGMLLSQIISVIVVQSFGENYHLHLSLFPDTFLGTVIFFGAIVLLLGIKNLFAVRKLKIIQMLQNSQKGVENIPLTRQVGKWVVVCTAVSTVILGMMAALLWKWSMSPNPAQRKWSWIDYRLWMSLRMERFWRRCRNSMNGNARYFWLERWRKKISRLWEQSLGCPIKGWLHFTTGRFRKSERALKEVTRDEF